MINFHDNDLKLGSILLVTAAVGLAGALGFAAWLQTGNHFSTAAAIKSERSSQLTTRKAIHDAQDRSAEVVLDLDSYMWKASVEEATRLTHLQITALAEQNKLRLVAFRPLRNVESDKVIQMPWQVLLEGPFPNIVAFERALEDKAPKVAVNLIQVAAAQEGTDKVSATVGIVGYVDKVGLMKLQPPKPAAAPIVTTPSTRHKLRSISKLKATPVVKPATKESSSAAQKGK